MEIAFFHSSMIPLLVGLPLIAAILCIIVRSPAWQSAISSVVSTVSIVTVLQILYEIQQTSSTLRYSLAGWGAPLGIDLSIDGLSIILLLVTAILIFILSFYSTRYFKGQKNASQFWPLWWLLVAGLNSAFVSTDAFNIYVALEMIGLSAVALVALAGTRSALTAALQYALVGLLGSLCYLLGVALLYRAYGTLDLVQLSILVKSGPISWSALALISVGLLLKTALLPLHFWLPNAHSSAPAPVSAVLSALVVKAAFYLLVRFWFDVLDPAITHGAANFLGVLGAAAIFWGCISALRAKRLKLMVAYSTVAQIGYLFLLFPLAIVNTSTSDNLNAVMAAVVYLIIAHALAKSAMFLVAGNILHSYGHDEIEKLKGLAQYQPATVFAFCIAGVSLIGLPPSGGFIAKWLLLNAAITNGQWWWVVIMLIGGLFAAAYIYRLLSVAFSKPDIEEIDTSPQHSLPSGMASSCLALALLAMLLGFNAQWILDLITVSTPLPIISAGDA